MREPHHPHLVPSSSCTVGHPIIILSSVATMYAIGVGNAIGVVKSISVTVVNSVTVSVMLLGQANLAIALLSVMIFDLVEAGGDGVEQAVQSVS